MKYYIVNAFTDSLFEGNQAGVCVLDHWLDNFVLQNIAIENNLPTTAFLVKGFHKYELRWFTPERELDLCGHAMLASAYIIMRFIEPDTNTVFFQTRSGLLSVKKKNDLFELDMPTYKLTPIPVTKDMEQVIGFRPIEAYVGKYLVCILANEEQILQTNPSKEELDKLDYLSLQITAKGNNYDCVTRSFYPNFSIYEDPICGSGHCHIIPYWSEQLQKSELIARQLSKRGGTLYCKNNGDRISISGKAVLYLEGNIAYEMHGI